jgi:hypothetical protein
MMRRTRYPPQMGNPGPSLDEEIELERRRALRSKPLTRSVIRAGPNVVDLAIERKHLQLKRHQDVRNRNLRRLSADAEGCWAGYLRGKAIARSSDGPQPAPMVRTSLGAA